MSDGSREDKRARARKQVRLLMARGEFAEARCERMMRGLADEAIAIRIDPGDQARLDRHAFRCRTLLDAERLLQCPLPDEVLLGDVFERYATRAVIASDVMVELRTSTDCILAGADISRWIMTVAAEMLHAVEAAADPSVGCRADVWIGHAEGVGLVMRVTSIGGAARPVPSASGMAAIERTGRVMRLFGAFGQCIEDDDLVYVATFSGCTVNEVD